MTFNIVFFISVTAVLIQGTTLNTGVKRFNVALPESDKIVAPTNTFLAGTPKTTVM